jgi:ornithine cyclodeaminase/alanine dehydrogenase-like protein (mu-crystallin family)
MTGQGASKAEPSHGLLVIDGATVEALVSPAEAIEVTAAAMAKASAGLYRQDIRRTLALAGDPGTCLSVMYAVADNASFGAKVQSVFPANFAAGLPSHQGGILLFDPDGGRPVALVSAHAITGLRTPAASAIATRELARSDACELAILGYGEQARRHIESLSLIRPLSRIRIWGRDPDKAARFAAAHMAAGILIEPSASAEEAVSNADIVCTVTSSATPVLMGDWLRLGTHVNAVGASVPALQEIDLACVTRTRIWVDHLPMTLSAASDIFEPLAKGLIDRARIVGEIGAVLNGDAPGRADPDEITLYRSLGIPAQDIALADFAFRKAVARGVGVNVNL